MKTLLITGINGFLGSHLAKRFSKSYRIIGTEFSKENLFRIKDFSFTVYLSDRKSIKRIFTENSIDIIIHTATFYGKSNEEISQIAETNLFTPFEILDLAIKNNVGLFINTDTSLHRYTSIYALTKKQFNDWLYYRSKEIKSINIQLEHFYGLGCSNSNFITSMIEKLMNNEPVIDLTKGEQKRNFNYYEDILDAYELIFNSKDILQNNFNHIEVGSGELITIKELMILLKDLTGSSSILNFGAIPYREHELMESKLDNKSILRLGWVPKVSIKEGIIKIITEKTK
ncbi:MAG TPA: NAD(P)-dependent oxidoreductase [Ignavibacteria bacterium]